MKTSRLPQTLAIMLTFVSACVLLLFVGAWMQLGTRPQQHHQTINSVLSDQSFVRRYGSLPTAASSEQDRISTHLEYVETLLRKRECSQLPPQQQQQRTFLLQKLREYRIAGKFPRNEKYAHERRPCFIDGHGIICAVGYLVEQSARRELAEKINVQHQYDHIQDMALPELDRWIQASGLTKEECAMIQPTYSYPVNWHISPEYAAISGVLGGTSIACGILNTVQIAQSEKSNNIPAILGVVSGLASVVNGAIGMIPPQFPQDASYIFHIPYYAPSPERRILSTLNIGIGAATAIISSINIFATPIVENKGVTWGLYSFPASQQEQLGVGLRVSVKL